MAQSSKVARIYRAREILLEHLAVQQGYTIDASHHKSITDIHSAAATPTTLNFVVTHPVTNEVTNVVYALEKDKLDKPTLKSKYMENFFNSDDEETEKKLDQLIILVNDEPNATIETFVRTMWQEKKHFIVVISLHRLQFNIMKHVLVPPHDRLTTAEADEMKLKYNIHADRGIQQLPEISRFSPVAQVIGLRPGEITRILRPSKTAIQSVFYRLCSN